MNTRTYWLHHYKKRGFGSIRLIIDTTGLSIFQENTERLGKLSYLCLPLQLNLSLFVGIISVFMYNDEQLKEWLPVPIPRVGLDEAFSPWGQSSDQKQDCWYRNSERSTTQVVKLLNSNYYKQKKSVDWHHNIENSFQFKMDLQVYKEYAWEWEAGWESRGSEHVCRKRIRASTRDISTNVKHGVLRICLIVRGIEFKVRGG